MDLQALDARLDVLIAQSDAFLRKEIETVATLGRELVVTRISETGVDAQGQKFPLYTPAYEQIKRGAVGTAKREGKAKKAARKTRQATAENPVGRYRGFRDFTFTGRMLTNTGVTEETDADGVVVVRVGALSDETRLKMEGNDNVTPGFWRLSPDEIQRLADGSARRTAAFIKNGLTG
jgi:hypothetical protein